jgi:uncharacterized protein YnzC (UPF0291/DUF896 family)
MTGIKRINNVLKVEQQQATGKALTEEQQVRKDYLRLFKIVQDYFDDYF